MKNIQTIKALILVFVLTVPSISFSQFVFKDYVDTLALPFVVDGMEFIGDDLWLVNESSLYQFSFPDMIFKEEYEIPLEMPISDITSDGSNYIWLGEGRGSPNGILHQFDLETKEFVAKNRLKGIANYQIQGIDYYEDKLWITNWKGEENGSILITGLQGNFQEERELEKGLLLPIAMYDDMLFTGNQNFLFAFDINIMGLLDFHIFEEFDYIYGAADIHNKKLWFYRYRDDMALYSIAIKSFLTSTQDINGVNIDIGPNPSSNFISLRTELNLESYSGTIIDLNGKEYVSTIHDLSHIDIQKLPAQSYILLLQSEDRQQKPYAYTFVKQ